MIVLMKFKRFPFCFLISVCVQCMMDTSLFEAVEKHEAVDGITSV